MTPISLFVVDRTQDRAARLIEALEPLGEVDWGWTANPLEAGKRAADRSLDAVLADWDVLGGIEGVRRMGFGLGTPLVVTTETIAQEDVVACLKAGAYDCVSRTNPARVRAAVAEALESAEFEAELEKTGPVDDGRYRELLEDLARADKARADFVGNLSHELRTPLNVIIGYTDMLLDDAFGALEQGPGQAVGKISRQARELLDLVNTTLELSRIEAGRIPLEVEPVDIAELLSEIEEETAVLIDGKDVRVTRDLGGEISRPRTDPIKLRVVLKNLVTNAMKFTQHGTVRISGRDVADGVEVAVVDTGPGIPTEQRESIFDAFQQGDTARGQRGAGLGLHIVRRLLDVLGGSISLESEEGVGSEFRIWIPFERGEPVADDERDIA